MYVILVNEIMVNVIMVNAVNVIMIILSWSTFEDSLEVILILKNTDSYNCYKYNVM